MVLIEINDARVAARDAGGHLVTIGSSAENQFVYQLFSTDSRFFYHDTEGTIFGPMIGLFQAAQSSEPSGGWSWETGEPLNFLGWSPGNPDNFNGRQNYARFFRNSNFRNSDIPIKYWDDTNYGLDANGFIIEIE